MKSLRHRWGLLVLTLTASFLFLLGGGLSGQAQGSKVLHLGITQSMFYGKSTAETKANLDPLNNLVQKQTGKTTRSAAYSDPEEIARKLQAGDIQVGVLTGFEFAWVQEKYPKLKPMAIAVVSKNPRPVVYLVAAKGSPARSFADFKGKSVALPDGSAPDVRLVLTRAEAKELGFKVVTSPNIEDALDNVVLGKLAATVADGAALDSYKRIKPGAFKRLKIVEQSPPFPSGAIFYREGGLNPQDLQRFRKGLFEAHKNSQNTTVMDQFHLTSFDPVPADYQQLLANIRKAYPPPTKGS